MVQVRILWCQRKKVHLKLRKAANVAARSLTPNKPHHAQWLITRKCNYRCKGCNVWTEQDEHELSTDEVKRGLDILRKMGIVEVVFSGGDPLLRSDIKEIIEYSSRYFVTTVYDNGSMASEKVDALRTVDFAAISFDSLDPEKMDYIKGVKGAYEKAMNSVLTLKKEGVNVAVTPTISQLNLGEIVDLTTHFAKMEVPVWYCLYSYDFAANTMDANQLFRIGKPKDEFIIRDNQAMVKLCDDLIELKKKNKRILMTNKLIKAMRSLYSENKRIWNCKALQDFFIIDHLGRVGGCHGKNFSGSVFDLPTLWDGEKFETLRKTYSQCDQCTYLCYIFYSLHSGPFGNLALAKEQWKNAKLLF
jgi:MoaA/NifB/PqqE/SkfB family radical SAM enzyme